VHKEAIEARNKPTWLPHHLLNIIVKTRLIYEWFRAGAETQICKIRY